ncbi:MULTISPECIES: type IV pilus assembly protein PilM [unclassified Modestobacter]|uniref:type IV pilus assembly protein PilM n=1 Tax=unclassified Modestobacter TaxID=2643866 RepID=UPI0022AA058A|nr:MULTISPECIES: type IV pilus assembly protein PilM [unclassified Modestobacter]MCZ2824686.1 type IV pilus assembly protein PilM [Modestobacter sp. VKM Ac-2981]MCZ2854811.1 type IV pilus assembly protein PilM [Modestobacter sp. VKM Ac-2982]
MARTHVVGLDLGATQVRGAELEFGKEGPQADARATLVRYGAVDLPPGSVHDSEVVDTQAVADALRRLWTQAGFTTKNVVIGVGNQRIVVREIELPWMPMADLKRSLPFQVADLLPMPVDEALLDFVPTEEVSHSGARQVRGMLVAARRDTVGTNLRAVEAAGLRPLMVDLSAFALQRALIRGARRDQTVAVVDIGERATTVLVAARGVPKLVRIIAAEGMEAADAVATGRLTVEAGERHGIGAVPTGVGLREPATAAVSEVTRSLVESIRNTFVYYASQHPGAGIDLALLTGGGADLGGFRRRLASESRMPVAIADPLEWVDVDAELASSLAGQLDRLAVSIGLAQGVAS